MVAEHLICFNDILKKILEIFKVSILALVVKTMF